jgi:adenine deaminase
MKPTTITGRLVDLAARRIFPARVHVADGRIAQITEWAGPTTGFILPGFIDAHVHVESSMLIPSEFARLAVVHGTVATVSDPHEIGNVLGVEGVEFMIANGKKCPSTSSSARPAVCRPPPSRRRAPPSMRPKWGACWKRPEVVYLSEMMNFPGVLNGDPEVLAKIAHAQRLRQARGWPCTRPAWRGGRTLHPGRHEHRP